MEKGRLDSIRAANRRETESVINVSTTLCRVRAYESVSNPNGMDTGPGTRQYPGQNSNSIPVTSSTNRQDSNKKRRTSTSGRGVANLTPEQLNKKRANDREAQRAIRERTKGQIESLQRKIQELTSQKPYQELQHALRQKELVEAENEEIKNRINSALGIIQPIIGGNGIVGRGTYTGHPRRLQLTGHPPRIYSNSMP